MMRILGLDTATCAGSVAVVEDDRLCGEVGIQAPATHADRLMSCVDFLLRILSMTPAELDGIAVSTGPGSFTGLRIGMGTAKGLSLATGKPAVGVSTLLAMARSVCIDGFLAPLIDAGRGEVYGACYKRKGGRIIEVCQETVEDPLRFLERIDVPELFFFGTGAEKFRKEIDRIDSGRFRFFPSHPFIASPVAMLGLEILQEGKAGRLIPNYIRRSDAERQRESRDNDP